MRSVSTTQTIAHAADALYQTALDVEKYPEFLPFCRRTRVLGSQESAKGLIILCEMEIAFGLLRESYTSEIIAENEPKTIRVFSANGPFRFLRAVWHFRELSDRSTQATFNIEYELRSRLLEHTVGAIFNRIFNHMIHAFKARAETILSRP